VGNLVDKKSFKSYFFRVILVLLITFVGSMYVVFAAQRLFKAETHGQNDSVAERLKRAGIVDEKSTLKRLYRSSYIRENYFVYSVENNSKSNCVDNVEWWHFTPNDDKQRYLQNFRTIKMALSKIKGVNLEEGQEFDCVVRHEENSIYKVYRLHLNGEIVAVFFF
jgi:hypothetical protein